MDDGPLPGVVLFEDSLSPTRGLACIAGEDPQEISHPQKLSSDVIWMTNVQGAEFYRTGFHGSNRFRKSDYLRSPHGRLLNEVGLSDEQAKSKFGCQVMADFFGNVMSAAWRLGVRGFPPFSLRHGFRDAYFRMDKHNRLQPEISDGFRKAYQGNTVCQSQRKSIGMRRTIGFGRHRYTHAIDLIEPPVPQGPWHPVPLMLPEEIVEHRLPLLLNVNVKGTDNVLGPLLNFGGDSRAYSKQDGKRISNAHPRDWMTLPEYQFLRPHADIEVVGIIEGSGYAANPLLPALDNFGPLQQISLAFLLCAESIWSAPLRNQADETDYSPTAAWINAYDRIACMRDAVSLMELDDEIEVSSYAYGNIVAKVPKDKKTDAEWYMGMIRDGVLVPSRLCQENPVDMQVRDDDTVAICQAMSLYGNTAVVMNRDLSALRDFDDATDRQDSVGRVGFEYSL